MLTVRYRQSLKSDYLPIHYKMSLIQTVNANLQAGEAQLSTDTFKNNGSEDSKKVEDSSVSIQK